MCAYPTYQLSEAEIRRSLRAGVCGDAPMPPLEDYVITGGKQQDRETEPEILEPVGDWGLAAILAEQANS